MPDNWIITNGFNANGKAVQEPINMDFVTKVTLGIDFKLSTGKETMLYIFHGVPNGSGFSGGNTAYLYASTAEATAARDKITQFLKEKQAAVDLNVSAVTLTATDTPAAASGTVITITLTGTGFSSAGRVTLANATNVNLASVPVGSVTAGTSLRFALDAGIAAGTYDIIYTDPSGNYAVLEDGIILS